MQNAEDKETDQSYAKLSIDYRLLAIGIINNGGSFNMSKYMMIEIHGLINQHGTRRLVIEGLSTGGKEAL